MALDQISDGLTYDRYSRIDKKTAILTKLRLLNDCTYGMRPDDDDPQRDPQQTLRPRQHEVPRRILGSDPGRDRDAAQPRGRRLKLGTPTRLSPTSTNTQQQPEVSASVQRGFKLGGADPTPEAVPASGRKGGVQPWILVVAVGAVLMLVVALLLTPSSTGSGDAAANQRLVRQYTQYLEAKAPNKNVDVNARKREVIERLQAVAWAKAVGDRSALEAELRGLLFMDDDKNSPLYQFSISQLKQLPASKAGL